MVKEFWFDLNSDMRTIYAGMMVSTCCVVVIMTANSVLFVGSPDIQYKCTDEQAAFVERTTKDCLLSSNAGISHCTKNAKYAYCTPVDSIDE